MVMMEWFLSRWFQHPDPEVRALRDLYIALDKRIRVIEDENLKTKQIVEASKEIRQRTNRPYESGWMIL